VNFRGIIPVKASNQEISSDQGDDQIRDKERSEK
jgi:hypothetical protein